MIKINGPNYYQGSGDYYLFGHFLNGGGSGKGIRSQYLFYNSTGNGWGDGKGFGEYFSHNLLIGDGGSYTSSYFKKGFLNDD